MSTDRARMCRARALDEDVVIDRDLSIGAWGGLEL